jgi:hypothetical protein
MNRTAILTLALISIAAPAMAGQKVCAVVHQVGVVRDLSASDLTRQYRGYWTEIPCYLSDDQAMWCMRHSNPLYPFYDIALGRVVDRQPLECRP